MIIWSPQYFWRNRVLLFLVACHLLYAGNVFSARAQDTSLVEDLASEHVSGQVIDSETNEALIGAHVFYSGTTIGDVTDNDGHFRLRSAPQQQINLVISMLGYQIEQVNINTRIFDFKPLTVALTPVTLELGEVSVIGDSDHNWRTNLRRFESIIFGDTDIGENCEILNPTVIDLQYSTIQDDLRATAIEPVVVLNPDLGYQIKLHALDLRGRERNFTWSSQPVFSEIETNDEGLREKWRKNRLRTYRGSIRHFVAALHRGTLDDEGFGAYHVADIGFSSTADPVAELRGDNYDRKKHFPILTGRPGDETRQLEFIGTLLIMYNKEHEPPNYIEYAQRWRTTRARSLLPQSSWLELPFATVTTDARGNILAESVDRPVRVYGFWAWERIGEWLPSDYVPDPD